MDLCGKNETWPSKGSNKMWPFSKHRPSGPMLSISRFVHMCVCLCVWIFWYRCFSLRLTVFLPPLLEVKCPNYLNFRNPLGKVMKRNCLRFETFACKECKIAEPKKKKKIQIFFLHLFTPFKCLFAPTYQSPMSKLFIFLESLENSNGKKWSQGWKLLLIKGVKSPRQTKNDFRQILTY